MVQPLGDEQHPYSMACRVGDLIFVGGCTGRDEQGHLVPGGIAQETARAIERIAAILHAAGTSLTSVVKVTVYMADLNELPELNRVYHLFFPSHLPTRTVTQAAYLDHNARVEIDMVASASG